MELEKYKMFQGPDQVKELEIPFVLTENLVAKYWGYKPWDFRSMSRDHKAELFATYIAETRVKGYYASEQAKKFRAAAGSK